MRNLNYFRGGFRPFGVELCKYVLYLPVEQLMKKVPGTKTKNSPETTELHYTYVRCLSTFTFFICQIFRFLLFNFTKKNAQSDKLTGRVYFDRNAEKK